MSSPPHDVSKLLAEHGRQLHALLFRLTLRTDVAEDLLQDLFCKLTVSDGFRRADSPPAFAYRTAINLAFDWRRRRKQTLTTSTDGIAMETAEPSPLTNLLRREQLEQTLTAIGELSPANRDIVVLRYLEQRDYESIADQFGKTAHQIRALAHKAIEQLRDLLKVHHQQRTGAKPAEGK